MPDENSVLERYALALSLVPDPAVAGDLFMDAWSDTDLRRRASRWCRRSGREAEMAAPIPVLTDHEKEYGLHLARRGRVRRWTKAILYAVLVVTAGVAAIWLPVINRINGPFGPGRILSAQVRMTWGASPSQVPVPLRIYNPKDLLVISRLTAWLDSARVEGPGQPDVVCAFSDVLILDLAGGRQIQVTPSCDRIQIQEGNLTGIKLQPRQGQVVVHEGTQTLLMQAPDLCRWLEQGGWTRDFREVPTSRAPRR